MLVALCFGIGQNAILSDQLEHNVAKKKKSGTFQTDYAVTTDVLGKSHEFDYGGDKDPEAAARQQQSVRESFCSNYDKS